MLMAAVAVSVGMAPVAPPRLPAKPSRVVQLAGDAFEALTHAARMLAKVMSCAAVGVLSPTGVVKRAAPVVLLTRLFTPAKASCSSVWARVSAVVPTEYWGMEMCR